MASRIDLKLFENDLVVFNDDFQLVESDEQHIADTINAAPGWWKENPTDGVGIMKFLKGKNVQQEAARAIQLNLQSDGYNSRPIVNFDSLGNLIIDTNVNV